MPRPSASRNVNQRHYENGCGAKPLRKMRPHDPQPVTGHVTPGDLVEMLCDPPVFGIVLRVTKETTNREARVLLATSEKDMRRLTVAASLVKPIPGLTGPLSGVA